MALLLMRNVREDVSVQGPNALAAPYDQPRNGGIPLGTYRGEVDTMPAKQQRLVFSAVLWVVNIFGWIMIAVAILGMPKMRFLTGHLAVGFGLLSSILLGVAGIAWLVGVKFFLQFFDRYLARN